MKSMRMQPQARRLGAVAVIGLIVVVVALARLPGSHTIFGSVTERPNVVVVMTDDQDAASLSFMQNVQQLLVQQGTTFTNSFVSLSECCPSRATYLTGQYPHNHGVLTSWAPKGGYYAFQGQDNTLPVWLSNAGYDTAHIGKYLNGYGSKDPYEIPPGWQEWYGSVDPSTYQMYGYTLNENGTLRTYGTDPSDYQTDVYTGKAVDYIQRHAPLSEPFFLSIAPLAPHGEWPFHSPDPRPAPRDLGYFASEPLPKPPSFNELYVNDKPAYIRAHPRFTSDDIDQITAHYRARLESLLAVDDLVGSIVQALGEEGELDNTLIIFTSDNGFMRGQHRIKSGKVVPYEESIRVPLVIRGPGIPAGARVDPLVSNIDWAPTIVDAAGASPGRVIDGISLLPVARDPTTAPNRTLLVEQHRATTITTDPPRFSAIRTRRYLYVEYATGEREFYDLTTDPYEVRSLHNDPSTGITRALLAKRLATLRTCAGSTCR
jgi:N-acetylglucosamine-6-sulfatase